MFDGVPSISEITNAHGITRNEEFMQSRRIYTTNSSHRRLTKHKMNKKDYTIWRNLLRFIFSGRINE